MPVKTVRQGLRVQSANSAYVNFGKALFPADFKCQTIFTLRSLTPNTVVWSEDFGPNTTDKRHEVIVSGSGTSLVYQYFLTDGPGTGLNVVLINGNLAAGKTYDITLEKVGSTFKTTIDGVVSTYTLDPTARVSGLTANVITKLGARRTSYIGDMDIHYFDIAGVVKCDFSDGTGTQLTDTSGNGNHGTIVGATWMEKSVKRREGNIFPQTTRSVAPSSGTGVGTDVDAWRIRFLNSSTVTSWSLTDGVLYMLGNKLANADIRPLTPRFWVDRLKGYRILYKKKIVQKVGATDGSLTIIGGVVSSKTSSEFTIEGGNTDYVTKTTTLSDGYTQVEFYVPPNTFVGLETAGYVYLSVFFSWSTAGTMEYFMKDFAVYEDSGIKTTPLRPRKNIFPLFTDTNKHVLQNGATSSADGRTLTYTAPTAGTQTIADVFYIPVIPGKTYVVSGNFDQSKTRLRIGRANGTLLTVSAVGSVPFTFVPPDSRIQVTLDNGVSSGVWSAGTFSFSDIQIEEGNTATAYEPYQLINDIKLLKPPGSILLQDSFNRANNATSLGNAETGQTWRYFPGATTGIIGNAAYAAVDETIAYVDVGQANVDITVTFPIASVFQAIIFRYLDTSNFWFFEHNGAVYQLIKKSANVNTTLLTTDIVPADGDILRLVCNGDKIQPYVNGVALTLITDGFNQAVTSHGFDVNIGGRADNITIRTVDSVVKPVKGGA